MQKKKKQASTRIKLRYSFLRQPRLTFTILARILTKNFTQAVKLKSNSVCNLTVSDAYLMTQSSRSPCFWNMAILMGFLLCHELENEKCKWPFSNLSALLCDFGSFMRFPSIHCGFIISRMVAWLFPFAPTRQKQQLEESVRVVWLRSLGVP